MKAWAARRAEAKAKGEREPRRPNPRAYTSPADKGQPGGMFNGMIAPLAGFTLRGVLFYQGENNSFTVGWKPFPKTFPAVITAWRKAFGDEKLPFGIIQIAGDRIRAAYRCKTNVKTTRNPDRTVTRQWSGRWGWKFLLDRKIAAPRPGRGRPPRERAGARHFSTPLGEILMPPAAVPRPPRKRP